MTTLEFLLELRRLGVDVWLEGGRLRCSAPVGVLDSQRREELARRKESIQALLEAGVPAPPGAVPIQPHGTRPPIFGVPGHNGDVFCFMPLSQQLGADQPFYGLQPPGLDAGQTPLSSVEDVADYFINAVRLVQPKGPYQIGGYCLGGLVAFEMARRLSAQGSEVSLVALFGTLSPPALTPMNWRRAAFEYWLTERAKGARAFLAASNQERIAKLRNKAAMLRAGKRIPTEPDDPAVIRKRGLEEATVLAARNYHAQPYAGQLTLFVPNRSAVQTADRPMAWRRYARDVEVCFGADSANGDTMLRVPEVATVARQLLLRLADATETSGSPSKGGHAVVSTRR